MRRTSPSTPPALPEHPTVVSPLVTDVGPADVTAEKDRGSASLAVVLVTPIMVVLMFAGWQAALWNHARTEARVVARETAVLVARDGLPDGAAQSSAVASLASSTLRNAAVSVSRSGNTVLVRVRGDAEGILRGTTWPIDVTVALPVEGWVPL